MTPLLDIQNLAKTYEGPEGDIQAVDGISLTLRPGDFVAVQGPSGCGKTTVLLASGALLQPTHGRVAVAGQDPYTLSSEARARFRAQHIGFVFQQFHLVPYLSVEENILAPTLALAQKDAPARCRELLRQFGLQPRARHVPARLSTGERQRVALARALLNRPQLLLADEPTGNLDRDNAEAVLECLAGFAREGGAVLLVTHDDLAARKAAKTLRMKQGRMSGDGIA